eukprot:Rhum_TRINITY_DN11133_c0_g1::Rhum_TRINITY_DN11133_c0_g1_i1::g.42703::m.42703
MHRSNLTLFAGVVYAAALCVALATGVRFVFSGGKRTYNRGWQVKAAVVALTAVWHVGMLAGDVSETRRGHTARMLLSHASAGPVALLLFVQALLKGVNATPRDVGVAGLVSAAPFVAWQVLFVIVEAAFAGSASVEPEEGLLIGDGGQPSGDSAVRALFLSAPVYEVEGPWFSAVNYGTGVCATLGLFCLHGSVLALLLWRCTADRLRIRNVTNVRRHTRVVSTVACFLAVASFFTLLQIIIHRSCGSASDTACHDVSLGTLLAAHVCESLMFTTIVVASLNPPIPRCN